MWPPVNQAFYCYRHVACFPLELFYTNTPQPGHRRRYLRALEAAGQKAKTIPPEPRQFLQGICPGRGQTSSRYLKIWVTRSNEAGLNWLPIIQRINFPNGLSSGSYFSLRFRFITFPNENKILWETEEVDSCFLKSQSHLLVKSLNLNFSLSYSLCVFYTK